jgi:DNA-binding GntR family transcriptional regulator
VKLLTPQPSLVAQAYDAILDEICDGTLSSSTHLIQESLAERFGVSRQPIQQALLLLKNDGVIEDAGRRGLIVAPLDPDLMRHHYQVRAALDALAAHLAAKRCAASTEVARETRRSGAQLIALGNTAVAAASVKDMIDHDVAFHAFIYEASGNPVLAPTAQLHWRYLRRVMGEVLRKAEPPPAIWRQHRDILDAISGGDAKAAERLALGHIEGAADNLAGGLGKTMQQEKTTRVRPRIASR